MESFNCSIRPLLTLGLFVCGGAILSRAQDPGIPEHAAQSVASPSSTTGSAKPDAESKTTERKRRFEEEKKRLEGISPPPQAPGQAAVPGANCQSSPDDLMLSPNLVNMLVGETQRFSLFDVAGHKLTSQAGWSVSDSSTAGLVVEDGLPVLTSKRTGTVHVSANVGGRSAEAIVNVINPEDMKPGTVHWSAPSPPCTKTAKVVVAVPH